MPRLPNPLRGYPAKAVTEDSFIAYQVSCYDKKDRSKERITLEISPLSVLVAAVALYEATPIGIEDCLGKSFSHVIDSIEEQFTILGISKK